MKSLDTTLAYQNELAAHKVHQTHSPLRFLVASMLAGSFVGIAVVLMLSAAGPFAVNHDPAAKLVAGGVFAVGLILVVFAGSELVTSAMMILTQGALSRSITWRTWATTLLFCFCGNLLGSVVLAGVVTLSGVLRSYPAGAEYLGSIVEAKDASTWVELLFRAILCNFLVCLAIWASNRCDTEIGKATVIFWCLLAFVASGYEHVVANMTTFALALFHSPALTDVYAYGRNLAIVGVGNLIGGAVFVGVAYWFLVGDKQSAQARSVDRIE